MTLRSESGPEGVSYSDTGGLAGLAEEFDWSTLSSEETATSVIPETMARKLQAFPARVEEGKLIVVMANPEDYRGIQTLELRSRMEVIPVRGAAEDIVNAINIHYSSSMPDAVVSAMDRRYRAREAEARAEVREIPLVILAEDGADDDSPVVQAIDSLISQALKARATDIHIEPSEDRVKIRFRIDGFLQEVARLPLAAKGAILSRIKIMAGMDIAERRRPQDGHFAVTVGDSSLEVRAATTDTVYGEMIVLRVLNKNLKLFSLNELGMLEGSVNNLRRLLKAPYGIILVSGPTGSGKTTTLYAALNEMDSAHSKIITIEDPVEYRFPGISSIQINEKAGLTFPGSLRAVLRLDPDIVLVGEIRDSETARIAVQAALTGHLVMSSVHANDSIRAVSRLLDLGVESFLLSSSLLGVISQRMVRRVCTHCAVSRPADTDQRAGLEDLGLDPDADLKQGEGCYFCSFTGYRGRTGIYEILTTNEEFRSLVLQRASNHEMIATAQAAGFKTMKDDGAEKIKAGITTPFEVMRSVYAL